MKLQMRMNVKKKCIELRTSEFTTDRNAMLKSVEFLKAFLLGFDLNDAIAFLRLDDLFMESFLIKDGKLIYIDSLLFTYFSSFFSKDIER